MASSSVVRCCESSLEERRAGNLHAAFCGSWRRVTASGDPVLGVRLPRATRLVILVRGTRQQAEAIRDEAAQWLLAELRMELSAEKTLVTHVDDGFDFLGHHIRRVPWWGRRVAWTYSSKKSLTAIKSKVRSLTTRSTTYLTLEQLLRQINSVLRGWTTYFRYDAAKRTFAYVDHWDCK